MVVMKGGGGGLIRGGGGVAVPASNTAFPALVCVTAGGYRPATTFVLLLRCLFIFCWTLFD